MLEYPSVFRHRFYVNYGASVMAKPKSVMKFGTSGRIVSPEGRLSYPSLVEATAFQDGDDPKFKTSLILMKDAPGVDDFINRVEELREEAITSAFAGKKPKTFEEWGLIDGDETEDPMYEGAWVIRAANKAKPALVDADRNVVIDKSEVYGGANARVNIVAFAYGTASKGGVTFQLLAVQLTGGGEAFGGAQAAIQAAANDF